MKKILLIDDSDTYTWCLQKYLQHRGYPVKTACTLKEARAAIQEEMPLVVCCDLDLPDGSGMDFLDEVRAADKELPFILASCHDKDDYEQEAMRRGATLCMDKMKGLLLQDKLVEYAYRQLSGEKAPTFHKLLFVHSCFCSHYNKTDVEVQQELGIGRTSFYKMKKQALRSLGFYFYEIVVPQAKNKRFKPSLGVEEE
ncbi:response regulator [Blautia faecis]|uniref:response regulator n=1 Tax=Blautia faecis TaxID=871665 RepID=UPI001D0289C9|nr:response regulator [Blautia faecis]MCB5433164.1 response regulator [Blautia faecis]